MLSKDQMQKQKQEIYTRLVEITNKRGAVDLWACYFWSVKDDFKVYSDQWDGIRYIRDIVAYWDRKMLLTVIDNFDVVPSSIISENSTQDINGKNKKFFCVKESLVPKLLEKYNVFAVLMENNKVSAVIFPILTKKGILVVVMYNSMIFPVTFETAHEIVSCPRNCAISIKLPDCTENIFLIHQKGKVKMAFCTTDYSNRTIKRIKLIPIKSIGIDKIYVNVNKVE
jgi:hypothetical protein